MATTATTKKAPTKGTKPEALQAPVFNQSGASVTSISLPHAVFGLKWNADLVHQVVVGMMANKRAGTANTKDRSEVSGGGKKPWKQKGTGRARHGSNRSPIWTGGGITHGPRSEKDYSVKINKKMRVKALFTVLSRKVTEGKILFIDSLSLAEIKTKDAAAIVHTLAGIAGFEKMEAKNPTAALIALSERNELLEKSFANIPGVTVTTVAELNAWSIMHFRHVVVVGPQEAIAVLSAKMGPASAKQK